MSPPNSVLDAAVVVGGVSLAWVLPLVNGVAPFSVALLAAIAFVAVLVAFALPARGRALVVLLSVIVAGPVAVLIAGSAGIGILFGSVVVAVWVAIDLLWWIRARQNAR